MDVRIERQARGAVHTVPRPASGQPPASRAAATDGPRPTLFDANGDGVIENWSIAHGGDSFANFDPPPSGTTESTGTRSQHSRDAIATRPLGADHGNARPTTPAALHHAHDAYQRDGLGAGLPARAPSAAPAEPAPAPAAPGPAPVVTQTTAVPALRSTAL